MAKQNHTRITHPTSRVAERAAQALCDDRGSVLGEYGTLLGIMAVAAAAAGAAIVANIMGWIDTLPTP